MKKTVFVTMINGIKAQREFDREMSKKLGEVFVDFDGWYNNDIVITPIEDALKDEFDDDGDMISYFMYDLEYGERWTKDSLWNEDGTVIDISTVEKLYDYLIRPDDRI